MNSKKKRRPISSHLTNINKLFFSNRRYLFYSQKGNFYSVKIQGKSRNTKERGSIVENGPKIQPFAAKNVKRKNILAAKEKVSGL